MSEKLEKPSWVDDESICPCGKKAGPDFRYGLCDEHANACPPVALLRWGQAMGRALTEVAAAEERGRRRGIEEERKRAIWIAQNVACSLDEGDQYIKAAHRISDMLADPKLGYRPNTLAPRGSGKEGS